MLPTAKWGRSIQKLAASNRSIPPRSLPRPPPPAYPLSPPPPLLPHKPPCPFFLSSPSWLPPSPPLPPRGPSSRAPPPAHSSSPLQLPQVTVISHFPPPTHSVSQLAHQRAPNPTPPLPPPGTLAGRIQPSRKGLDFRRGRFTVCNVAAPTAAEQVRPRSPIPPPAGTGR